MSRTFALALFLASPLRAGVVVPVENGVAPAGPSAPVMPLVPGVGTSLTGPSQNGASFDLRGAIPLLPAPVPGLAGPRLTFVGDQREAAAVSPQAAAVSPSAAPARARRATDQKPTLPAKPAPGASSPAVFRDRDAASTPASNASVLRKGDANESERPLVETSSLEHALPETAAGAGRRFFDQSRDSGRGALENPSSAGNRSDDVATIGGHEASFGPGGNFGLARGGAARAGTTEGAAAGRDLAAGLVPGGETLRDAVGTPPSPGAAAGAGAVSFFRSASPNGEVLSGSNGAAAASPGAPRPLALDLSRSGLIVRVRSALGSVLPVQPAPQPPARLSAAPASTALLERGGMLEAFSVVDAYAGAEPGSGLAREAETRARAGSAPLSPVKEKTPPAASWLALLLLPALAAARRFL